MSFPDYLNKIINSQIKNKQIENVRAEITKLISTHRPSKNIIQSQHATSREQMPKTMVNFFNVRSVHHKQQPKFEPRKTFSEVHINKLKKRLTVQEGDQRQSEHGEPEGDSLNEWRLQMLKHLKAPPKKQDIEPEQQTNAQNLQAQIKKAKDKKMKDKQKTTTPTKKKTPKKQNKVKEENTNEGAVSQRNIILIRPQPLSEQQLNKKAHIAMVRSRPTLKHKRILHKNETESENEFTIQRLANFTALLPFLGTQKAKVQARQQKKKITLQYEAVGEKIQYKYAKKMNGAKQEVIQISGWEIPHQF